MPVTLKKMFGNSVELPLSMRNFFLNALQEAGVNSGEVAVEPYYQDMDIGYVLGEGIMAFNFAETGTPEVAKQNRDRFDAVIRKQLESFLDKHEKFTEPDRRPALSHMEYVSLPKFLEAFPILQIQDRLAKKQGGWDKIEGIRIDVAYQSHNDAKVEGATHGITRSYHRIDISGVADKESLRRFLAPYSVQTFDERGRFQPHPPHGNWIIRRHEDQLILPTRDLLRITGLLQDRSWTGDLGGPPSAIRSWLREKEEWKAQELRFKAERRAKHEGNRGGGHGRGMD